MTPSSLLSGRRSVSVLAVAVSIAAFGALGLQTAAASKDAPAVPAPPTLPTRADQIQNIDQVKTAIKAYYGDMPSSTTNPVDGTTNLRTFSDTGAYAQEMAGLTDGAWSYLADPKHGSGAAKEQGKPAPVTPGKKAILFDVDDTSLNTYNYEIYSNFVFNPTSNAAFVNAAAFPGVPHMADLANQAKAAGYTVFFLTGRPEGQRPGTETNLQNAHFPVETSQVYLKNDAGQSWITCDTEFTQYDTTTTGTPSCNTVERKSQTRAHIESLGYDIVANFGDQFSDLEGGFADRTFKLPNPNYYLP